MKKLIALLLAALMLVSLAACDEKKDTDKQPETTEAGSRENVEGERKEFMVTVVHADGREEDFFYETTQEFIGPVLVEEGLIKTAEKNSEQIVVEADGEKIDDSAVWIVYEGEYPVEQNVDTTRVVDGRIYKIVYTPV